jgi:hypothetical protein
VLDSLVKRSNAPEQLIRANELSFLLIGTLPNRENRKTGTVSSFPYFPHREPEAGSVSDRNPSKVLGPLAIM